MSSCECRKNKKALWEAEKVKLYNRHYNKDIKLINSRARDILK